MNLLSDLNLFAAPPRVDLHGGPLDAAQLELPGAPGVPTMLGLGGECPSCGEHHLARGGAYRLVGDPAPGYAGQFLWVPGDPL